MSKEIKGRYKGNSNKAGLILNLINGVVELNKVQIRDNGVGILYRQWCLSIIEPTSDSV